MINWLTLTRDQRLAHVAPLWREGKSAREISQTVTNASRNAVIGVIHRAGLSRLDQAATRRLARHNRKDAAPKPEPRPRRAYIIAGSGAVIEKPPGQAPRAFASPDAFARNGRSVVPMEALRYGMCRWPLGDPLEPGFGFCGCRAVGKRSYCAEHFAASVEPAKPGRPRTSNELARSLRRWIAA